MAQAKKAGTNWFAVVIATVTVLAIVGVGALVVVLNNRAAGTGDPEAVPSGERINVETGAISFGAGDTVVATFIDFACPGCQAFEAQYGEALAEAQADDRITLDVHPISILDRTAQGTGFSTRAASAMYCVAESAAPEQALDFLVLMFANQTNGGLSDSQIVQLAQEAGAGDAASCINSRRYLNFVKAMTPLTPPDPARGVIVTPTVTIDGERVDQIAIELPPVLN